MLTNTEIFHYPNKTDVISDAILITLLHHYLRPISNLCWKPIVKKANESIYPFLLTCHVSRRDWVALGPGFKMVDSIELRTLSFTSLCSAATNAPWAQNAHQRPSLRKKQEINQSNTLIRISHIQQKEEFYI